jgi:DNA-binding transcriptional LysR family regulator
VELRQLRYFVTLAEELHFGRAAAREHIVQSALSQQIQRLERELGVALVERSTHHVRLTESGEILLAEARQILAHVEQAASAAREARTSASLLRVAVGDPSFDSIPQVLRAVQATHPELVIHRVEASVPEQYRMLADGRLDVGVGRAAHAPSGIACELFRLDPLGLLLPRGHRLARLAAVPLGLVAAEAVVLAEHSWAPEFNEFVLEACRAAGFAPELYPGSAQSVRSAAELVEEGRCVAFVPASCDLLLPTLCWRPLTEPALHYPWSLLWPALGANPAVQAVRESARELAGTLRWLNTSVPARAVLAAARP